MTNWRLALLFSLIALLLCACVALPTPSGSTIPEATASAATSPAHWEYSGEDGPSNWGELSPAYALCGDGTAQSPIDLAEPDTNDLANIVFAYQPSALNIVNTGHTIQVNYDEGSFIEVDGERFDLLQFHFHMPSEHLVDGAPADGELHLVHANAEGELAVVGLFLLEGAVENVALKPVFDNLPAEAGPVQTIDAEVRADLMLPMGKGTYRYNGSLTTPPCSEGVSWYVLTLPVEISTEQYTSFTAIYDGNNRPVQPLDDRIVVEDTTH